MQPSYAELHCASNFSFLRGASHPEELVERALALGYTGLAITDECSFAGSVRAHLALREARSEMADTHEFRLIHGTEIRLVDGPRLVLLAQTRAGYGNLSELITLARRAAPKGEYRLTAADLTAQAHLLQDTLALLVPSSGLRPEEAGGRERGAEAGFREAPLRAAEAGAPCKARRGAPTRPLVLPQPMRGGVRARAQKGIDVEKTEQHARWLQQLLPGRTWIACELI
ncbi:MAG TPA: PHP domain-containing protein, partial [Burkholderiaceae bacterium]